VPSRTDSILAGYDWVPNPFVLAPPRDEGRFVPEGGETGLRLVLIGRAIEHAGFARQAVVEAGLRGLGPDHGALYLVALGSVAPPPTAPRPERVEIALLTPLRLVEAGRLVGPGALRPRPTCCSGCCATSRPSPSGTGAHRSTSITAP
jgi:hypothetical protein